MRRKVLPWLCGAAVTGVMVFATGLASAASRDVCKGTVDKPGVLVGLHRGDLLVEGVCIVPAGPAEVHGTLTVGEGSSLIAAFGLNGSRLTVDRNVIVERGATLVLGCKVNPDGTGFPCVDEPNREHPTLTSHGAVGGSIVEKDALGVIVHNSSIGGDVVQTGGGGGLRCDVLGIFKKFMSPVYSDYEDSTIGGSLEIRDLHSCYLGVARVQIGGSARVIHDRLADPDAIEILSNHIGDDLACFDNSMVWDSHEAIFGQAALYPRTPEPNSVGGTRLGQCVLASPATDSSPPGPGPF